MSFPYGDDVRGRGNPIIMGDSPRMGGISFRMGARHGRT